MEIGSFIELSLPCNKEYYMRKNTVRLNSGRAGIYHSLVSYNVNIVYIPYYQCETVREFLLSKNIEILYYFLNDNLEPIIESQVNNSCVLIPNYFGIFQTLRMKKVSQQYRNVIIDNSQSFFSEPIENCLNVYSARKFFGVPDGCYVIGDGVKNTDGYNVDYSSKTASFLLKRIEYGCTDEIYKSRLENEKRIDNSDVMQMSKLTHSLLDAIDYQEIIQKRKINFEYAHSIFKDINKFDLEKIYDNSCVPMVYPLVFEDSEMLSKLLKAKHFQGRWWNHVILEVPDTTIESWLSKYLIPITIDQRYSEKEIDFIRSIISRESKF